MNRLIRQLFAKVGILSYEVIQLNRSIIGGDWLMYPLIVPYSIANNICSDGH